MHKLTRRQLLTLIQLLASRGLLSRAAPALPLLCLDNVALGNDPSAVSNSGATLQDVGDALEVIRSAVSDYTQGTIVSIGKATDNLVSQTYLAGMAGSGQIEGGGVRVSTAKGVVASFNFATLDYDSAVFTNVTTSETTVSAPFSPPFRIEG